MKKVHVSVQQLIGIVIMLALIAMFSGTAIAAEQAQDEGAKNYKVTHINRIPLKVKDQRSFLDKLYDYAKSFFSPGLLKVDKFDHAKVKKTDVVKDFINTSIKKNEQIKQAPNQLKKRPSGSPFVWERSMVANELVRTISTETDISRTSYQLPPPSDPNPTDAAGDVPCSTQIQLSWQQYAPPECPNLLFNIYLEANNPIPGLHTSDHPNQTLDVTLACNTTYYWRVEVFDPNGVCQSSTSPVWHFNTGGGGGADPFIPLAGYWDTHIDTTNGGTLTLLALVTEVIDNIEVFAGGQPTGIYLKDDGSQGDFGAGDGVYGFQAPIGPGAPSTQVVLELIATNSTGGRSDIWPYLNIRPGTGRAPSTYLEKKVENIKAQNDFNRLMKAAINGTDRMNKPARQADNPFIYLAGYWDTRIQPQNSQSVGDMKLLAYPVPGATGDPIQRVELYYNQVATGAILMDDGANADFGPSDGIYGMYVPLDRSAWNGLEGTNVQLEIVATDAGGRQSDMWPFLSIHL